MTTTGPSGRKSIIKGDGEKNNNLKSRLAFRKDAPVVRERARGSVAKALKAARPENREEALKNLEADKVARSSKWTSRWRTWQRLHAEWMGYVPPSR